MQLDVYLHTAISNCLTTNIVDTSDKNRRYKASAVEYILTNYK